MPPSSSSAVVRPLCFSVGLGLILGNALFVVIFEWQIKTKLKLNYVLRVRAYSLTNLNLWMDNLWRWWGPSMTAAASSTIHVGILGVQTRFHRNAFPNDVTEWRRFIATSRRNAIEESFGNLFDERIERIVSFLKTHLKRLYLAGTSSNRWKQLDLCGMPASGLDARCETVSIWLNDWRRFIQTNSSGIDLGFGIEASWKG